MRIGIVLYPTFGGSGIVATELGKALSKKGHEIHFITYSEPVRLGELRKNIFTMRLEPQIILYSNSPLTNKYF